MAGWTGTEVNKANSHLTHHPPTGSPHHSSHCPYWQGAHTFMVSTHVCPKHTPYTPNTPPHQIYKSYCSTILVSFLYFICWAKISLRPDEVASVWMPVKACHGFIMILLCFSTTRFYSSANRNFLNLVLGRTTTPQLNLSTRLDILLYVAEKCK